MTLQKIFFSYSRADGSEFALKLALDLKNKGFDVWIDQVDIRAGSEWDIEIEKALETCDCLLFIETEKSVTSNNVLDEVYYAIEQRKKVIPLILVDSKTPFRLQRIQHINFTKDYQSGLALLINELQNNNTAVTYQPEEKQTLAKAGKPFLIKYAAVVTAIICLLILTVGALIYSAKNKKSLPNVVSQAESKKVENEPASIADVPLDSIEPKEPKKIYAQDVEVTNEKKITAKTSNRNLSKAGAGTQIEVVKEADLNEIFAGDWQLLEVEPKARLKRGYLKIEPLDEKKVSIKSYLQFYYPTTNETSFLTVFNAFAGCASCMLTNNMKLAVEDISIGSRTIKTLKENQSDCGKAGDTILDANSNKSIRAAVTLHLVDKNTAIIKVQLPAAIALAHELILEPFIYSFRFKKSE
ncbi:MAG: toll/interleukin-1 receptor domain-containing protein [Chitinophagaceae bacterium]|nr:toll/interleukin-1 receptor domain-containing protein [Chitinophagaceae bacterium]